MNNKISAFFVVLVLLLFALLYGLFHVVFEQRESERDVGLQGEAAFNPLLIAQKFLENSGIESESVVSMLKLKKLPAKNDILFLATRRFDIGPTLREKLMLWVASGGHLIIVAWPQSNSDSDLQDPILENLEISIRHEYKTDNDTDVDNEIDDTDKNFDTSCTGNVTKTENLDDKTKLVPEINSNNKSNENPKLKKSELTIIENKNIKTCDDIYFKPLDVTILTEREKSKVAFNPSNWLTSSNEKKANWVINGESGAHLVEYVIDKGLITVLSDYDFLTNENFRKFDHAAFFWYLVHYSNNSGKVWIVYKGDMPPLYVWLAEHLWAPFLTLFFIIAVWIWSVLPRFGALYPKLSTDRRNLIEHIRASGQFLWKNKFSDGLIHETRNALQEQISRRHPNWNKLTEQELVIRLAKQTGISSENIELAFTTQAIKKEHEFFLIIQTLERLRKSL